MELVYVQRGSEYTFRHSARIMTYFLSLKQLSDDELWDMSCRILPASGDFDYQNRQSDRSFLAATLSPRGAIPSGPVPAMTIAVDKAAMGRQRSASIGDSFRKWKPRKDSDPSQHVYPKSGNASPHAQSPRSPRSQSTGGLSPRPGGSSGAPMGGSEAFACPLCCASCGTKARLLDHLNKRLCATLKQHTCPVCEAQFGSKEDLVPHVTQRKCSPRPNNGPHACPLCDGKFGTLAELRAHLYARSCVSSNN